MLVFGHRGAKGLAPENTLAGFKAALDAGVDGIEFDVRVSKDGIPIVIHDPFMLAEGKKHLVGQTNLKTLQELSPDLPELSETLTFLANKTALVIEIKPGVNPVPIIAVMQQYLKAKDVTVSSFDPKILQAIKSALTGTKLSVNEKWSGVRATYRARKLGTKYITMNQKWLWSGYIRSVTRNGYLLSAYTINDPAKAKSWAKAGLYAAITDHPDKFSSV